jgi:hydroxyethylthiazole kinase-like uncharacterized protein yjeF
MSSRPEPVTPQLLREWGLPDPGDSKKSRGQVIVVGGSRSTPGAVLLAGEAALRVGAGRLGMLVPPAAEPGLGTVMPEAAVLLLPTRASDPIGDDVADELESADAVLIGPGFDDPDQTRGTLLAVAEPGMKCLILDAFALGVLPDFPRDDLPEALILNPNHEEAGILLGRDLSDDPVADLLELAQRFDAVVNCYGVIAAPDGSVWQVGDGGAGLGTSGSGDVLAGAITGFAARGVEPSHAAVWGSWTHARAGDRLTERAGLGFLARELAAELAPALTDAMR